MTKQHARLIVAAVAAIVLLIVVAQNITETTVTILFLKLTMPLALLIIGVAIGGFMLGILAAGFLKNRKKKTKTVTNEA